MHWFFAINNDVSCQCFQFLKTTLIVAAVTVLTASCRFWWWFRPPRAARCDWWEWSLPSCLTLGHSSRHSRGLSSRGPSSCFLLAFLSRRRPFLRRYRPRAFHAYVRQPLPERRSFYSPPFDWPILKRSHGLAEQPSRAGSERFSAFFHCTLFELNTTGLINNVKGGATAVKRNCEACECPQNGRLPDLGSTTQAEYRCVRYFKFNPRKAEIKFKTLLALAK